MRVPSAEQPATFDEAMPGLVGALGVTLPTMGLGLLSTLSPSEPGNTHPLREIDIFGIPDFLDRSGNLQSGSTTAFIIIGLSTLASFCVQGKHRQERYRDKIILGTGILSSALTTGLEIAYEAGATVRPQEQKPTNEPFDSTDALFGSVSGILTAVAFCATVLRARRRAKKQIPGNTK